MKYDFATCSDRTGVGSEKWDDMLRRNPEVSRGVIPFSVADMELPLAPEIAEGLRDFLGHAILGYAEATDSYYAAVLGWLERRHAWRAEKEWLVETNGVVPALFSAVNAFTRPGEGVMIMTPVYYPFSLAVKNNDRRIADIPLLETRSGYEIDFDRLAEEASRPENKLLLLCSPHNPVGRVWTRGELERIADICLRNGVFVAADEIHFDLLMPGREHTVFASLSPEVALNCLVATSPSKTFNLAGAQASNIFFPDKKARELFIRERRRSGLIANNLFAYISCELAYTRGENWLAGLLDHIAGNFRLLAEFMAAHFPEVTVHRLEGTYLAWLDFRAWGFSAEELEAFMARKAELFFSQGRAFGEQGAGFERMNLACPRDTILAALERLRRARSEWQRGRITRF